MPSSSSSSSSPETEQKSQMRVLAEQRLVDAAALQNAWRGDHGILYARDALKIFDSLRPKETHTSSEVQLLLVQTHFQLSESLKSKKKHKQSLDHLQKALGLIIVLDAKHLSLDDNDLVDATRELWEELGNVYFELEGWNDAMKAYQTAARLEVRLNETGPDDEESSSFNTFLEALHEIESTHVKNRKGVWSKFPHLPAKPRTYQEYLEASMEHELQGDALYEKHQYQAARIEYTTAQLLIQEQLFTKPNQTWDNAWLTRKLLLVDLAEKGGKDGHRHPFSLHRIHDERLSDYSRKKLPSLRMPMVYESIEKGDALLHDAKYHKAANVYKETKPLVEVYWSIQTTVVTPTRRHLPDRSQRLNEWLAKDIHNLQNGIKKDQSGVLWATARELSILVETQQSTLKQMEGQCTRAKPEPASCPNEIHTNASTTYDPLTVICLAYAGWCAFSALFGILRVVRWLRRCPSVANIHATKAMEKNWNGAEKVESAFQTEARESREESEAVKDDNSIDTGRSSTDTDEGEPCIVMGGPENDENPAKTRMNALKFVMQLDVLEREICESKPSRKDPPCSHKWQQRLADKTTALILIPQVRAQVLKALVDAGRGSATTRIDMHRDLIHPFRQRLSSLDLDEMVDIALFLAPMK